jgi:hypothetical protein
MSRNIHTCIWVFEYVSLYANMCKFMYIHMYIHVCLYTYVYVTYDNTDVTEVL